MIEKQNSIPPDTLKKRHKPDIVSDTRPEHVDDKKASFIDIAKLHKSLRIYLEKNEFTGFAQSVADIGQHAEQAVAIAVENNLPQLLEKKNFSSAEKQAIVTAVAHREFPEELNSNPDAMNIALVFCLVSEKSRMSRTIQSLKNLSEDNLTHLGMPTEVRDVFVATIPILIASNTEYLRAFLRGTAGKNRDTIPVDPVREWRRQENAVNKMIVGLQDSPFITQQGDSGAEFINYLKKIAQSFVISDIQNNTVYSKEKRDELMETAREAYREFYKKYPHFPIVLLPTSDTYLNQGFQAENKEEGIVRDVGLDPEMRIVWQAPQEREKAELLEKSRQPFVDELLRQFPDFLEPQDVEKILTTNVIIGQNLFAAGINIKYLTPAQRGKETTFLIEDTQEKAYVIPAKEKIKKLLPADMHELIDSPEFSELYNDLLILHEYVHEIFPTESESTVKFKETNDLLKESKSDLLARTTFVKIFSDHARERFGDQAIQILNLVMLTDDLASATTSFKDDDSVGYWVSVTNRLNSLAENGLFVKNDTGFEIDLNQLDQDLGTRFANQANEILQIYQLGNIGKMSETDAKAKSFYNINTNAILDEVTKFLNSDNQI